MVHCPEFSISTLDGALLCRVFLGTEFVLMVISRGFPSALKAITADGIFSSDCLRVNHCLIMFTNHESEKGKYERNIA
jgi:hypothetical protein